jgi:hypothetical protein
MTINQCLPEAFFKVAVEFVLQIVIVIVENQENLAGKDAPKRSKPQRAARSFQHSHQDQY